MEPQQVRTLVREFVLDLTPGLPDVPSESALADLGVDSMSLVDLLFKLEREFDIAIPDEALPRILTVGDLVTYVTTA